jgi:hypothetical protein
VRWLVFALVLAACDREPPKQPPREPQPPRRIIEPPTTGISRQLPPHAIRNDGVGPYKIGDPVAVHARAVKSGPQNMRFELPGVVRTGLLRAEDDGSIIIGGETQSTVTFVAVVGDAEIARTEKSNVHVGSTAREVEESLGPLVDDPDRARDPRVVIPNELRNLRVVLERDRVAAIVVTSDPTTPRTIRAPVCERPEVPRKPGVRRYPACLTQAGEIVEVDGEEIVVRPANGEGRIAAFKIQNLVFAEPLRHLGEGRDEIVAVTSTGDAHERRWSIVAYRLEGARFVRSLDSEVVYELTNARTRWMGVDLDDVQLLLELTAHSDGIEVGGLLTTQNGARPRDVVVISPIRVARKSGKSTPSEGAAGAASGSAGARVDAGSANL